MIRKTLYLLAAFCLTSCALAMEEWEPALTMVPSVPFVQEEQDAEPCSLLEQLPLELLKMIYDKLDPDSRKVFLTLSKGLQDLKGTWKSVTLKDEAGIPCLSSMPGLEALKIACEFSSQSILQLKPKVCGLKVLDLSDNKLWTEDLAFLVPSLTKLQQLSLRNCYILRVKNSGYLASLALLLLGRGCSSEDLSYLANLTQLRQLDLNSCNHATHASLRHVAGLTNLQVLDLENTEITYEGLRQLTGLTQLQVLSLADTRVGNKGLACLVGLTRLRELDVSLCGVNDDGVAHLTGLTQLRSLNLNDCRLTDEGVAALAVLTNLEQLNLGANSRVTHVGIAAFDRMKNLQRLSLILCHRVSDRSLAVLGRLVNLQQLNLAYTGVTGEGLQQLTGLLQLQRLSLDGCIQMTGDGIAALQAALPGLIIQAEFPGLVITR